MKKCKYLFLLLKYYLTKKDKYLTKMADFAQIPKISDEPIEINTFIPIGSRCHTAMQLQALEFRKCSFPFDWIVSGVEYFDMLSFYIDEIVNDFSNFINFEDLEFEKHIDTNSKTWLVRNSINSLIFGYDFDINLEPDNAYNSVMQKYKRRIQRLYDYINSNNKICLIYMQHMFGRSPYIDKNIEIRQSLVKLNLNKLKKKFPNKKIILLCFQHNSGMNFMEYKIEKVNDNGIIINSNHKYSHKILGRESILSIEKFLKKNFYFNYINIENEK